MQYLNPTFNALTREAAFTREILGSAATELRKADYASMGRYFQAFTGLATGLERIGKLCIMLDHYIEHNAQFPDFKCLRQKIGHNLVLLYTESQNIVQQRAIKFRFDQDLSGQIHQAIIKVLSDFAKSDRYANINLLVGNKNGQDPILAWFKTVDEPTYQTKVPPRKKALIEHNASVISSILGSTIFFQHTMEDGKEVSSLEEGSVRSGVLAAVAPYRQLYVLQGHRFIIKYQGTFHHPFTNFKYRCRNEL
jgi:hypothetical protein